jgi:hypothetical protein
MNSTKWHIVVLLAVTIIALATNVPTLPTNRYVFHDADKTSSYSNYFYATVICDTWTGEVSFAADGKFSDEDEDAEFYHQPVGRVLRQGKSPSNLLLERYGMLSAIVVLTVAGIAVLLLQPRR